MLVDSHCHLSSPELVLKLNEYLADMQKNQVSYALCVATTPSDMAKVVQLANSNLRIFATVGVHPEENLNDFSLTYEYLADFGKLPRVVAIGETGLDYYWDNGIDSKVQIERFLLHIEVAKDLNLPLVIHTRNAAKATYDLLKNSKVSSAVIHCFTEDKVWATKFLELGCYISISGIVTFKNAVQVQEVAKYVPLESLLIETDAPYLAPVPFRGKLNHPALVLHTAEFIADLRGISLAKLSETTTNNFFKLFSKARTII